MDWTRVRAILLVAFTLVNLVLAYSIWGPDSSLPALAEPSNRVQTEQLRARLAERGLVLPPGVTIPPTPAPMQFLRVEYRLDLNFGQLRVEPFRRGVTQLEPQRKAFEGTSGNPEPTLDPETRAILYYPKAMGPAARDVKIDNRTQVRQVAEEYLKYQLLLPSDAQLSRIYPRGNDRMMVEFVPYYRGLPVYSGYLRVEVSSRGVETVTQFWVRPIGFKDAAPKAIRPAGEALLRLAGHVEQTGEQARTIVDMGLGYYSGPSVTMPVAVGSWDTVPVWRVTLDNGTVYYINAFNSELES